MKKIIFVLFVAVLFTGCDKVSELTRFDIPISRSIDVPALATVLPTGHKATLTVSPNLGEELSKRSLSSDRIEEIVLKSLGLELTSPTTGDLTFLKSVTVEISAEGLEKKRIAYAENVPDNVGKTLTLAVENVDLKNYFLKESITLEVTLATDKVTTSIYSLKVNSVFTVDLKVLGF